MRILIATASKHGATTEIGDVIGAQIRMVLPDVDIDIHPVSIVQPGQLRGYDAAVIGSSVYMGHWMPNVVALVRTGAPFLFDKPVWLFSSGPVGSPPKPDIEPVEAAEMSGLCAAREHRVFAGRIRRAELSMGERLIVRVMRIADSDDRNWTEIVSWARGIATWLDAHPMTTEGPRSRPQKTI